MTNYPKKFLNKCRKLALWVIYSVYGHIPNNKSETNTKMKQEPADEDSSFAVGEAQHGKDPLQELGWKLVYICHNLHLQLLGVTQPLENPKTTVSGGKLRPVVHKVKAERVSNLSRVFPSARTQRVCSAGIPLAGPDTGATPDS